MGNFWLLSKLKIGKIRQMVLGISMCVLSLTSTLNLMMPFLRLGDLLAVPMQRILKYHLLLRELLQNTPQAHEEYHAIHQVNIYLSIYLSIFLSIYTSIYLGL